ncbi:hypothetical protein T05_10945 [Trichinella murrelli]|uniref:Uncharacterized protein n=1 Tax=Trichinella murrelli TaxID=144512 RepID=A0A0V0T191_9BILA|nr:hypothetical protein T05_10945 [Trichinella murrelli]
MSRLCMVDKSTNCVILWPPFSSYTLEKNHAALCKYDDSIEKNYF